MELYDAVAVRMSDLTVSNIIESGVPYDRAKKAVGWACTACENGISEQRPRTHFFAEVRAGEYKKGDSWKKKHPKSE